MLMDFSNSYSKAMRSYLALNIQPHVIIKCEERIKNKILESVTKALPILKEVMMLGEREIKIAMSMN